MLAIAAALVLAASRLAQRSYLREGQTRSEAALRLTLQALDGYLRRYEAVPDLLADDDDVQSLLADPQNPALLADMNHWLVEKNALLGSSDIYVMTPDGVTVAASNHARTDSFIGQNFSYRPYFAQARAGGRGRYYAIGTTSGVRGYYFAAPVWSDATVSGVIAVKIGLDLIEAEWRTQDYRVLVTDPEGIVFLSSDPGWLYQALLPLTPDRLARSHGSRRYAEVPLSVLPYTRSGDGSLLRISGQDGIAREYLAAQQLMPGAGWTVHVLLDTAYLRGQARLALAAFVLLLGVGLSVLVMIRQRRAQLAERIALQDRAKLELERRVEARTADLARVNALIETEIAERRLTEQELRQTQADLVQAGKLAALGQMSAALSHEINQPLAAARNYADSATILIERGDPARARDNLGQIVGLIDRISTIAKHLRNVARKPDAPLKDVDLGQAVAEAVAMARDRLDGAGMRVVVDLPPLPLVWAGPVRLQQVLVNVLTNAADASADSPQRVIEIGAEVTADQVMLTLRDRGPGVPAGIADRIFDPFFTTKRVGSGLGLGLSISYNIMKDFGGDLRCTNAPDGGAVFTLVLKSASLAMAAPSMLAAQ